MPRGGMTCAALDEGHHPAVISGIMKLQATERMRIAIDDAMDIHGGKAVIEGPQNYLGSLYRGVPVGITVEGANIVTRKPDRVRAGRDPLPSLSAEGDEGARRARQAKRASTRSITCSGNMSGTASPRMFRAWGRAWTGGLLAPAQMPARRQSFIGSSRATLRPSHSCADMALLTLGGALKRKEMLSARFGDILSELYLSSAALKRWNDEGRQQDDFPLLAYCMEASFATIETRFDELLANFPIRPVAWLLRLLIQPLGPRRRGPSDRVTDRCADLITHPSVARDRLTVDLYHPPRARPTTALRWSSAPSRW
jgi:acyl-CoA dehydrogenase